MNEQNIEVEELHRIFDNNKYKRIYNEMEYYFSLWENKKKLFVSTSKIIMICTWYHPPLTKDATTIHGACFIAYSLYCDASQEVEIRMSGETKRVLLRFMKYDCFYYCQFTTTLIDFLKCKLSLESIGNGLYLNWVRGNRSQRSFWRTHFHITTNIVHSLIGICS